MWRSFLLLAVVSFTASLNMVDGRSRPGNFIGLIVKEKNTPVPLKSVNYNVQVRSFASRITIEQVYKNEETSDLECVYGFPINDQASVVEFTVTIDDRVIQSEFKKKEEAFKEYNEALKRGDGAYLLDQADRSDDTFILSVGRLPPGKECLISISYVSTLESINETTLRLVIPTSLYPRYNPTPLNTNQQVAPPDVFKAEVPYTSTLNASITTFDKIKSVSSPTHPVTVRIQNDTQVGVTFGAKQPLDKDFFLDIEVNSNPEQHVEVEEYTPGKFAAMYSYVPHSEGEKKKRVNTEIIFVVDCSGSMLDENKIDDARTAMQLFLRSLPEGSYFNFYKFGSRFTSLFPESVPYNETTFNQAKNYSADAKADLGGTEILEALKDIYSKKPVPEYSRQIFVLTDGEVTNTDEVISLVRSNSAKSRVFAFGLGLSPSRSLVNGIAMAGNGKAEFIKHGEDLADKIGRHLRRALQPAVVDAAISWVGVKEVQQVPTSLPPVFYGDRQLVYALFERDPSKGSDVGVKLLIGADSNTKRFGFDLNQSIRTRDDLFISKLAAKALIKEIEINAAAPPRQTGGSTQTRAQNMPPAGLKGAEKENKERITNLSLTFGVMSKHVSLLAIETRNASSNNSMELREIPVQLAGSTSPLTSWHHARPMMAYGFPGQYMSKAISGPPMYGLGGSSRGRGSSSNSGRASGSSGSRGSSSSASFSRPSAINLNSFQQPELVSDLQDATTTQATIKQNNKTLLNDILALQNWDGSWSLNADLINLIPAANDLMTRLGLAGQSADEKAVTTLFVSTFIQNRFTDQTDTWDAIVVKALEFVKKLLSESVRDATVKRIQTIL